jgi:hypothetical protein
MPSCACWILDRTLTRSKMNSVSNAIRNSQRANRRKSPTRSALTRTRLRSFELLSQ